MTKRWGLGYAMAENGEPNGIIQAAFSEGAQGSNTMKSITLDALQKEAKNDPLLPRFTADWRR